MDLAAQIRACIAEAQNDDETFSNVYTGAQELTGEGSELNDLDRTLFIIREMLRRGFVPVTTAYQNPPGLPWPEKHVEDIIARIEREFSQLTDEPMFLDICWFRLPREAKR